MQGRFVVLEGIDGSGTTSVSRALVQRLSQDGVPASWTCEPSRGPVGQLIRRILKREVELEAPPSSELGACLMTHLFQADRIDHIEQIKARLATGEWVVCDRYLHSTIVYQGQYLGQAGVMEMIQVGWPLELLPPDLSVLLNLPVDVAMARRTSDPHRTSEEVFEDTKTQVYVANAYRKVFVDVSARPVEWELAKHTVVDATQPLNDVVSRVHELVLES